MFERLEDYPEYADLFADFALNYAAFKHEALKLVSGFGLDADAPYQYNQQGKWKAHAFKWRDAVSKSHQTPVGHAFVSKWGDMIQSGLYSYLGPRSSIPAHTEQTRIMRCHLPLIVPTQDSFECGIRVQDEIRPFLEGRVFLFRDFNEHEVWNHTDKMRINLILDLPDTNYERDAK